MLDIALFIEANEMVIGFALGWVSALAVAVLAAKVFGDAALKQMEDEYEQQTRH